MEMKEQAPVLPNFPYDVVACILDHTNIGRVATTVMYFGSYLNPTSREQLRRNRNDPRHLFRALTDDPDELLEAMRLQKVILSGSRALDHFNPGSASPASDYDFYGEDNLSGLCIFALYLEQKLGVQWSIPPNANMETDYAEGVMGLNVVHGVLSKGGQEKNIQLIWRSKHSASQCVMLFHSTAPQCFISGFAAVSLHHKLTSRDLSAAWPLNDFSRRLDMSPQEEKNTEATRKYEAKGYNYVDLVRKGSGVGKFGGWHRNVGDSDCWIMPFDEVFDVSLMKPSIEKYLDSLKYLSWIELDGCNVVTSNPLYDYAGKVDSIPDFYVEQLSTWTAETSLDYTRRPWYDLIQARGSRKLVQNPC